jgi:hypothetical protein
LTGLVKTESDGYIRKSLILDIEKSMKEKKMTHLTNSSGSKTSNREEILKIAENYYRNIYKSDNIADNSPLSDQVPGITKDEIQHALKQMKNGKASGEDNMAVEMLKLGGDIICKELAKLFIKYINLEVTPKQWDNAIIVLLYKKGDPSNIKNYRPISLLSQV